MKNIFTEIRDIGIVKNEGKTIYNKENQTYVLSGSGKNLWFKDDEFHFASKKISGDFIMTCSVDFVGEGVDSHRKAGLMIRSELTGSSIYADVVIHGDGLTSLQYRPDHGVDTLEIEADTKTAHVIQIERSGDMVIMRIAEKGQALIETGHVELSLDESIFAGIFVGSHNEDVLETAVFRNFRIDIPAQTGTDG